MDGLSIKITLYERHEGAECTAIVVRVGDDAVEFAPNCDLSIEDLLKLGRIANLSEVEVVLT